MNTMTSAEYKKLTKAPNKNKYGAKRVVLDGYSFDSQKEAKHYQLLKHRQSAGEIEALELHPSYTLHVNGVNIGRCVFDFKFYDTVQRKTIVQDVKGYIDRKSAVWRLFQRNVKHVAAEYNINVEVI